MPRSVAAETMPITAFNHGGVTVADLDASLAFWCDLLELELLGRGEVAYPHLDEIIGLGPVRLRWAELAIPGGGMLELFEYVEPQGTRLAQRTCDPGAAHLCFEVQGIDAIVERCRAAGVTTRSDRAVRIVSGDWIDWRCLYMVDPDGFTVELVERPL